MNVNPEQIIAIHNEATAAAQKAAQDYFKNTLNNKDQFPCGFSWVKIYDVKLNTKLGKAMAAVGFEKAWNKGIELWNPSKFNCQNVDTLYAGSRAYAAVFESYGFKVFADSRWD